MPLKLYFHPLSSFSQKVLTALYENDTPFEPQVVNLFDEDSSAKFRRLWPIAKIPLLWVSRITMEPARARCRCTPALSSR